MKLILGFAGEIASGKGTVAKYIKEKHDGGAHRFSTMLRDVLKRMYLEINRENMQKISRILREGFHQGLLSEVICHDVDNDEHKIIAIDGVRRLTDIKYLQKLPGFKLIYIETDMEKRYERIVEREENSDDKTKTFEQFEKDHQREAELQIKGLKDHAEIVIDNNGSFEDLYKQVDELIDEAEK